MSVKLEKDFSSWMDIYLPQDVIRVGVGVSGGADSLCLVHLLKKYCDDHHIELHAFTVDHGLRKESAHEAKSVHSMLTKWGVKHQTLRWVGQKPKTGIEEKARQARYDLMYQACQKKKIKHLFLAHHIQDQAETFWLRLAHGSGVDGLAGMEGVSFAQGMMLMRPLLGQSKTEILNYLKAKKIQWFEDKMNQDSAFERVRWRERQKTLTQWGITPEKIYALTRRIQDVRQTLSFYAQAFVKAHVFISPLGYAFIQHLAWDMIPQAVQIRVLQQLLPILSGEDRPISLEGLENLLKDKRQSMTFAGCQFVRNKKGLYITIEHRSLLKPKSIKTGRWGLFDIIAPKSVQIEVLPRSAYFKNIPSLIQKGFPYLKGTVHYSIDTSCFCGIYVSGMPVLTKKELEKKAVLDYKKGSKTIYVHFNPRKN